MCSPFSIDIRPRRLPAEIKQIEESSNDHGIHCYVQNDSFESLEAIIPGPKETPYEEIVFKIAMEFDSHYPFRPPTAKFLTPVYHPNIDTDGKICLDVLRMPPGGSYNPAITLESILLSIQLLLASPNPDDPLRDDISNEYRYNRELFNENARKYSGADKTDDAKDDTANESPADNCDEDMSKPLKDADEDESIVDSEERQEPNTSKDDATATRVPVTTSKPNRKRKHDET